MADVNDFLIDFKKEDKSGGGGRINVKPGQYPVDIVAAKPTVSAAKQTPGLELKLKFTGGPAKGKTMTETLWATPKAYSRFRGLLEACDIDVPTKINLVKIASLVKGSSMYVDLETEVDKTEKYGDRSRVSFEGFINEADYDPDDADPDDDEDDVEDDDEEPEPAPAPKAKKKKAKPAPVEDDEDDDDLDLDEL